jgi:hypothetical protein
MLAVLIISLAIVIGLACVHVHVIKDSADADVLWNAQEAYLFVQATRIGWRVSYLHYFGAALKAYLRGATPYTDRRPLCTVVFRVRPEGVQRFVTPDVFLRGATPVDHTIYARDDDGKWWKWLGAHIEPASPQEQHAAWDTLGLSRRNPNGTNGWYSERSLLSRLEDDLTVSIALEGQPLTLRVKRERQPGGFQVIRATLDLLRPAQAADRLWDMDEDWHRVTQTVYRQSFGSSEPSLTLCRP